MKVLILNGPNLNLLGKREPGVYGSQTLDEIMAELAGRAVPLGVEIEARQSNHEGVLIDWLHGAEAEGFVGIVFNAGGYTHTSVALRDAIAAISLPVVECHLSNIHAREPFRHHSYLAPVVKGQVAGFGKDSYYVALVGLTLSVKDS